MSQPVLAPPVPSYADLAVKTKSMDELQNALSSLVAPQSLVPMTRSGEFDGSLVFHGRYDLGVFNLRCGRKLSIDLPREVTDPRLDNFAFLMAPTGSAQLLHGPHAFEYGGSKAIIFSGAARTLQFSDDCESQVLLLDRAKLTECCSKLLAREIEEPIALDVNFALESEGGQRWQRVVHYAAAELRSPDSLIRQVPALLQQLEQVVHTTLLYSQRHNYLQALLKPQSAAAPFYVRRAEAYIEAHFSEPLTLPDIAAHARVSARSLQNGFRSFRNTTPMAFLRSLRMQKAHHILLATDPADATVTGIAFQCGFTHMGDFATAYKRHYGVSPSQTLVRSR